MSTTHPQATLVEEKPWLLLFFGAPNPLRVFATAGPLVAWLLWTGRGLSSAERVGEVAAGALYWSFFEYAMHRWFYHWRPKSHSLRRVVESFHVYHHRHIADRAVWNAGPLLVLALAVILALPVALLLPLAATATLMTGTVLAYYVYEWAHYLIHAHVFRRGPLAYLQGFHLHHHHGNTRACFGVTNPFWDLVFRTAAPRATWITQPRKAKPVGQS